MPHEQVQSIALPGIRIHATLAPKLNLAFHQNAVPVLRELAVTNNAGERLQEVTLTFSSEPAFFKPKNWHIDTIGAGQRYQLSDCDVALDGALLGRLTEAEMAVATFVLTARDVEAARLEVPMELLARNQWGGIGHMPEMAAAFVQPNDPAVERLLKKAADVLRRHGKSGSLNRYERGPRRAWELVSAIWTAVGALGLDYALPPASFEHAGQKIRSPGQIFDAGLATCLDTTLLFCAALEQCRLNPLIVFTRSHAFAGVWLKAEEFTTVTVDDVTSLRKRVKLQELALFETTMITHPPSPTFSHAAGLAAQQISEAEEDNFELAIDIRRARLQRIRPPASAQATTPVAEAKIPEDLEPVFEEAPELPDDTIVRSEEAKPGRPQDRLDRWQRKLLDLSLRNSLLDFPDPRELYSGHAPERTFYSLPANPSQLSAVMAAAKLWH